MFFLNHNSKYYKKRSEKIKQQQQKWKIEKKNLQRQNVIKKQYKTVSQKNPFKITTGKLALWIMLIICIGVIIFTGYITVQQFALAKQLLITPDYTPLVAMVGGILGAVFDVLGYYAKSAKENTEGGVTYMKAAAAMNYNEEPNSTETTNTDEEAKG